MVKIAFVASLLAVAGADALAVTWKNWGSNYSHAQLTDVQPIRISTGSTETLVGSFTVDEDVTKAQFKVEVSSLVSPFYLKRVTSCSGDGTADIECQLPFGAGVITVKALTFPIKKGAVKIPVTVKTSSVLPPSLEKLQVSMIATEQNGKNFMWFNVNTAKSSCPEEKPAECAKYTRTLDPDMECYDPATHHCIDKTPPNVGYCDNHRFEWHNIVCGLTEQVCDGKCVPADGLCSQNKFYEANKNMKECWADVVTNDRACSYGCHDRFHDGTYHACPRWVCHQACPPHGFDPDYIPYHEPVGDKWDQCGGENKPEWCCSAPTVDNTTVQVVV